eukprot:TRINITY_DN4133_c0_g1_i1.p1 TRINITY_DN4133_c0_g1~~TRINITY_DN4133_c0_g1_i1.p1  ORF type:complete len:1108 (-),score=344.27 TRINITY_DN4133_c0_g1_i1:179-3502(-)
MSDDLPPPPPEDASASEPQLSSQFSFSFQSAYGTTNTDPTVLPSSLDALMPQEQPTAQQPEQPTFYDSSAFSTVTSEQPTQIPPEPQVSQEQTQPAPLADMTAYSSPISLPTTEDVNTNTSTSTIESTTTPAPLPTLSPLALPTFSFHMPSLPSSSLPTFQPLSLPTVLPTSSSETTATTTSLPSFTPLMPLSLPSLSLPTTTTNTNAPPPLPTSTSASSPSPSSTAATTSASTSASTVKPQAPVYLPRRSQLQQPHNFYYSTAGSLASASSGATSSSSSPSTATTTATSTASSSTTTTTTSATMNNKDNKESKDPKRHSRSSSIDNVLNKNYSFSKNMLHQSALVEKQVKSGLALTKGFATYLKSACAILDRTSQEAISKGATNADEVLSCLKDDGMRAFVDSIQACQESLCSFARHQHAFYSKVLTQVAQPILDAVPALEIARAKLAKDEEAQDKKIGSRQQDVQKHRAEAIKRWEKLVQVKQQRDQEKSKASTADTKKKQEAADKSAQKLDKEIVGLKEKARKAFEEFEKYQQGLLEEIQDYRSKVLPSRLKALEDIELKRMNILAKSIKLFTNLQKEYVATFALPLNAQQYMEALDAKVSLSFCIEKWVHQLGDTASAQSPVMPLPCEASQLDAKSEDWVNAATQQMAKQQSRGAPSESDKDRKEQKNIDDDDDDDDDEEVKATGAAFKEEWMYAIKDHIQSDPEYLLFKAEDIIHVTQKEKEWWYGYVVHDRNQTKGKFAPAYVTQYNEKAKLADDSKDQKKKETSSVADFLRGKVSKKKRRFQKDGFDLDLVYITPQIIAMGFPAESLAGMYRNNMKDVQRFLGQRHGKKYRVYNLCIEKGFQYDHSNFENRVACFPFSDHNPCFLNMIDEFCKDCKTWLSADRENVAAIHCKAGKGRTGLMIASYLLYDGVFPNADYALRYYAIKRTTNASGVTIPSQIRYVYYYDRLLQGRRAKREIQTSNPLILSTVILRPIPKAILQSGVAVWFTVECADSNYSTQKQIEPDRRLSDNYIAFHGNNELTGITTVDHDVNITFYHSTSLGKEKMFQFWFNTRFCVPDNTDDQVCHLTLSKSELDKACKDKKHSMYTDAFRVELTLRAP